MELGLPAFIFGPVRMEPRKVSSNFLKQTNKQKKEEEALAGKDVVGGDGPFPGPIAMLDKINKARLLCKMKQVFVRSAISKNGTL